MRLRERRLGPSGGFYADRLVGLTTTRGASEEEGDSEDSKTMTEALTAEVEGMMLPRF